MANQNRNRAKSFRRLLSGISSLLVSWLVVTPVLAKGYCQADLKDASTPNSDLGCFKDKDGLREAIKLAQVTKLPLLTEQNLNSAIQTSTRNSRFSQVASEAKQDLKAFLKKRFTLTPEQFRQLDTLSASDIAKIQAAIDEAQKQGAPLSVKINQPPSGLIIKRPLSVQVQNIEQPTQQPDVARIRIVIEIDK